MCPGSGRRLRRLVERYGRNGPVLLRDLEEDRLFLAHGAGEGVAWHGLDRVVELQDSVVVELPGVGDLVLDTWQLFLEHGEVLVRLQLWVSLGDRGQATEG